VKKAPDPVRKWFQRKGWKPFAFQESAWKAFLAGSSGLVHAPTGVGKTYAIWIPAILEWLRDRKDKSSAPAAKNSTAEGKSKKSGQRTTRSMVPLRLLWITPLRALANDTVNAMRQPITELDLPWAVEIRTGDTSQAEKARQLKTFPTALVTTPESLSLLLSYPETRDRMSDLTTIVVDEWHELLGTKRGAQTELCLARLRAWNPAIKTWGLSATLGNLDEALDVLLGAGPSRKRGVLVSADLKKEVAVETVIPGDLEQFPWAGHLGIKLLPEVIRLLENARTTLLFTNTRSQTEIWFRALVEARPDWLGQIALHHGSIDREARHEVEERLRAGTLRCVVCTSSLDLGVDFSPVEQVIQMGAPKGVARMLQRAGRSGHRWNAVSRIFCVPAHALELVEFAAVREAIAAGELEKRVPLDRPLDVLAQHLVTLALGGGFEEEPMRREIQSAHAYRNLTDREWQWCLDFVTRGGQALQAYPQFRRVVREPSGFHVREAVLGRLHRLSIGTITSDSSVSIRLIRGAHLGTIEESFIARLKPGDRFTFGGIVLEFSRLRDMTAFVRRAKKTSGIIPQWMGGKMPLSSQLAVVVRRKFAEARAGIFRGVEMEAVRPVLEILGKWSAIPNPDELLVERVTIRDGTHHFIYPFAGRLVHEGLAALLAHRAARIHPASLSVTINDYGFGLLSSAPITFTTDEWRRMLSPENLVPDLMACLNTVELAKRQFREIARVGGLIFQGYPGAGKSTRQIQASSGLFYDVFTKYDPENLLLEQARREVLERQLEVNRMKQSLEAAAALKLVVADIDRLTPLSFPLWAAFVQVSVSSESWTTRIQQMSARLEDLAREVAPA
jgi:ATP-dependent Lhr-like helicase